MTPSANKRSRLDPEARRRQLLDVAASMVLRQGFLPLPLVELGRAADVSKALVYTYFPTQHDLFNALLQARFDELRHSGLTKAAQRRELTDAATECAGIYFDHVSTTGPLIHIIMRDLYMSGHLAPEVARYRNFIARHLARGARRQLGLTAKEAFAAFNLIMTIPEEAGRIAFDGSMKPERARLLCLAHVNSAIQAISPPKSPSPTRRGGR
jgi:AcrR family transcriptional regulator